MESLKEFIIPAITEERLLKIYEKLKPVVWDVKSDSFKHIELDAEDGDLRNVAFTWTLDFTENKKGRKPKLIAFDSVVFLSSSYRSFWKPSVAEVFAFIQDNEELLKDAVTFSVEPISTHESGRGNIGKATFYKRVKSKTKKEENK